MLSHSQTGQNTAAKQLMLKQQQSTLRSSTSAVIDLTAGSCEGQQVPSNYKVWVTGNGYQLLETDRDTLLGPSAWLIKQQHNHRCPSTYETDGTFCWWFAATLLGPTVCIQNWERGACANSAWWPQTLADYQHNWGNTGCWSVCVRQFVQFCHSYCEAADSCNFIYRAKHYWPQGYGCPDAVRKCKLWTICHSICNCIGVWCPTWKCCLWPVGYEETFAWLSTAGKTISVSNSKAAQDCSAFTVEGHRFYSCFLHLQNAQSQECNGEMQSVWHVVPHRVCFTITLILQSAAKTGVAAFAISSDCCSSHVPLVISFLSHIAAIIAYICITSWTSNYCIIDYSPLIAQFSCMHHCIISITCGIALLTIIPSSSCILQIIVANIISREDMQA